MSADGRVARRALRRWSWRLYRREWRQQGLVVALITVAVAASVLGATAAYNATDNRVAEFGSANHRFENAVSRPADIPPYLAEAEEWFGTIEVIGHQQVPIPGTTATVELRSIEPDGAYSSPTVSVLDGRRPAAAGETALTAGAAADLDAALGDQVEVGGHRFDVVGIVENPADLDDEFALVPPAGQVPESITLLVHADSEHADRFRPRITPGQGFIESRQSTEQATAAVAVFVIATVAMVLVCLVAGASFATLAHRRMRQLGLLAAAGATPRHLRRAMVANGTAVGLTAAVAGTGAGLLAWLASASALERAATHRIDRWNIPIWLPVVGIALAVATATMAAWWPARAVARMPITDAVAARPPAPRRLHRSLAAAVALFAFGVLAIGAGIDPKSEAMTPLWFISGIVALPVAVLLASAPVLRAVARLAGRLPVGTRLAVRDLARFESRSAAALGAITLALGIAVSVVVVAAANVPDADEGNLQADQLVVWTYAPDAFGGLQVPELTDEDLTQREADLQEIAALAPGARVVPLDVAVDPSDPEVVGGQPLLNNAVLGRPVNENTVRDSGRVFVATNELLDYLELDADDQPPGTLLLTHQTGEVFITGNITNPVFVRDPVPADDVVHIDVPNVSSGPRTLITAAGLDAAGLEPMRAGWLLDLEEPLAAEDLVRAREIAAGAGLAIEDRDSTGGLTMVRHVATAAGVLLALSILAMTAGLLRSQSRHELRTLQAVGATRRIRRAITASTCGVLALAGAVLAVVIAYAALLAGYWPENERLADAPVPHLVALVVGLPLVAAGLAWVLGGGDRGLEPTLD
jgi:putative ABC transport system permease protein